LFLCSIVNAPGHLVDGAPHHLRARFLSAKKSPGYAWHYVDHHMAHAASAFFASPFQKAAILTLDGRGEKSTTGYYFGEGLCMDKIADVQMPHSFGLLYEAVTTYLGFLHSSDEYKVMALASYGNPAFIDYFDKLISVHPDGTYTIGDPRLEETFGPPRERGGPIEKRHLDIASSLQKALEQKVLQLARWLHNKIPVDDLCIAGGVGLNCVLNARLRDHGPFKRIWVQPAAGDSGTALGAALWVDIQSRHQGPGLATQPHDYRMDHAYLGPSYSDEEIYDFLCYAKQDFAELASVEEDVADLLTQDKVVGWFQGRMEFGPRALGARSIIASPLNASMQARLNEIKDREDFRPVAPVVLEEEANHWFLNAGVSPFMLFVHDVQSSKAGLIPAVRHVDGTARIQTIRQDQNPKYYGVIKEFQKRTGVPVLVNTSFNTRGKPIVCTPRDAVECFHSSPIDALVIGSFLLHKREKA
ncbi:carbamoyltransferase, partial [bacterium]